MLRYVRPALRFACITAALLPALPLHADTLQRASTNNGSWTTSNVAWRNAANFLVPWTNSNSEIADFNLATTSTTVTIGGAAGNIVANGLVFDTNGYTVALTSGSLTLSGPTPSITVTNAADSATISAPISGIGGLTFTGDGTLILAGVSNYSNGTFITSGTVQSAVDNALSNTATSVSAGATLDLTGFNQVLPALQINGTVKIAAASDSSQNPVPNTGQLNLQTLTGTGTLFLNHGGILDIAVAAPVNNFAANINPTGADTAGSLIKGGKGKLVLLGTSRLTGAFSAPAYTVTQGILEGNTGNLGSSISVAADTTLLFNQTADGSFTGAIDGPGNVDISGSAAVTFSQANTYSGATNLHAGATLAVSSDNQLGTLTTSVQTGIFMGQPVFSFFSTYAALNFDGGTLRTNAGIFSNRTVQISANGGIIDTSGQSSTFTGSFTGPANLQDGQPLTITGGGTVTFSTATSSFIGLAINHAFVVLDNADLSLTRPANNPLDVSLTLNTRTGLILQNGATLLTSAGVFIGSSSDASITLTGAGTSWTNLGAVNLGVNSGSGSINMSDGATAVASALNTGNGPGSQGTLDVESGSYFEAFNISLGSSYGHATAAIIGAGSTLSVSETLTLGDDVLTVFPINATGALTLSAGASAIVGTTVLSNGSSISVSGATFSTATLTSAAGDAASIAISDAATPALVLGGAHSPDGIYYGTIADNTSGPGSVLKTGPNTQSLFGNNSYTGSTRVTGGNLILAGNSASSGFTADNTATLTFSGNAVNLAFNSITANAGGNIVYNHNAKITGGFLFGPGAHTFNSASLTGTQIFNGAQVTVASATFTAVTSAAAITVAGPGSTLTWNGGANNGSLEVQALASAEISNFTSSGIITLDEDSNLDVNAANLILSGGSRTTLNGADPRRAATLNLNANNSIQLNGGLLTNNGAIFGPTFVNFGGVAKGSGTYGQVTLTDGGKFSPGNSPGNVITTDTTWGSAGTYEWQLSDAASTPGTGFDHWSINGALTINAGATTNSRFIIEIESLDSSDNPNPAANFDPTRNYSWEILSATDGINNFNPNDFTLDTSNFKNDLNGGTFSLSQSPTALNLNFTAAPVPEPATLSLAALGILLVLTSRPRRSIRHS